VSEYGYAGSLRSIQRYWARTHPAPAIRARRRVETPPGAQAQVDWAHFPGIVVGALQAKISRAREQLLTFLDHPRLVEATNNACERALRPAVVQRKVTNGYLVMGAAEGEAVIRTVVDTARLTPRATVFSTILATVSA
jgi:transposase IS66 family protein